MNKVLKFSPKSTRDSEAKFSMHSPWSAQLANYPDAAFLRTWLVYNSEANDGRSRADVNWYAVLGLVLTIGVSAGFWTGVGVTIAQVWK